MTDERQAGLREPRTDAGLFLSNGLETLGFSEADAYEAIVAIEDEALAGEERLRAEGWEWQCASCHRPVAPMGMCETCGVFGIMRAVEYRALGVESEEETPRLPDWPDIDHNRADGGHYE